MDIKTLHVAEQYSAR